MAAGFDKTDPPLPWLVKRRLQLVFGSHCDVAKSMALHTLNAAPEATRVR
jgi:hypothetical protein